MRAGSYPARKHGHALLTTVLACRRRAAGGRNQSDVRTGGIPTQARRPRAARLKAQDAASAAHFGVLLSAHDVAGAASDTVQLTARLESGARTRRASVRTLMTLRTRNRDDTGGNGGDATDRRSDMRETQSQSERRRGEEKEKEMREEVHSIPFSRRMPLPGKCGRGRILAGWAPSRAESGGLAKGSSRGNATPHGSRFARRFFLHHRRSRHCVGQSSAWTISLELVEASLIMQQASPKLFRRSGRPFALLCFGPVPSSRQASTGNVTHGRSGCAMTMKLDSGSLSLYVKRRRTGRLRDAREDILDAP